MATAITTMPVTERNSSSRVLRVYWKECKYQFLQNLRMPRYSASVIAFPVMFYILFGLLVDRGNSIGNISVPAYLLATYGTFGILGASLFGTAAGLATSRSLGWMQVKRASPMPPFAYFVAWVMMAIAFSALIVILLMALGFIFGGVHLSALVTAKLFGVLIAGSLPFCAMGIALGYFVGASSAPAIINLIYLPLSFASGLWIPFVFLPKFVQHVAFYLPPYHLAQLCLDTIGAGQKQSAALHWEVLFGFSLICLGIARLGFQRDEKKTYS